MLRSSVSVSSCERSSSAHLVSFSEYSSFRFSLRTLFFLYNAYAAAAAAEGEKGGNGLAWGRGIGGGAALVGGGAYAYHKHRRK